MGSSLLPQRVFPKLKRVRGGVGQSWLDQPYCARRFMHAPHLRDICRKPMHLFILCVLNSEDPNTWNTPQTMSQNSFRLRSHLGRPCLTLTIGVRKAQCKHQMTDLSLNGAELSMNHSAANYVHDYIPLEQTQIRREVFYIAICLAKSPDINY